MIESDPGRPTPTRVSNEPAIRFASVVTTFGDELVLDRVSFDVDAGDFVCLLGPSGCGKSTTLRILGDLLDFDEGDVEVGGRPPKDTWRDLAYVFQQPRLLPWRTVLGNVMVGMDLRGVGGSKADRRATAVAKLALVGLADAAQKYPGVLSGGERQRVAFARALAMDPHVVFMDEPLSALDIRTKHELRNEIVDLWQRTSKTILFVTHDLDEALFLADKVIVFSNKPTRILRQVAVEAPRPRDLDQDPELQLLRKQLHQLFQDASESDDPADRRSELGHAAAEEVTA
ncbi:MULTISPECIES: ABC transporter ATP-binding protein [unclassified Kribbella]|uniref:ABC transporter ATP-binding protein n=1 Tax=unclassified Kribbella TaxID=2644121 RepID=UPI00340644C2